MGISYDVYLDKGTTIVQNICTQSNGDEEEKKAVVTAFGDELERRIFQTQCYDEPEIAIYGALIKTIDMKLKRFLGKAGLNHTEYEAAIKLYTRQIKYFKLFSEHGWNLPDNVNLQMDKWKMTLEHLRQAGIIRTNIIEIDAQITSKLIKAETDLDPSICDSVKERIYDLAKGIEQCKRQHIQIPKIENYNTDDALKRVKDISQKIKSKQYAESVCTHLLQRDKEIAQTLFQAEKELNGNLCDKALKLIQEQKADVDRCRDRNIIIDQLEISDPESYAEGARSLKRRITGRDELYFDILKTDKAISSSINDYEFNRGNLENLIDLCDKQNRNFNNCKSNQWQIPGTQNSNINFLLKKYNLYQRMIDLDKKIVQNRQFGTENANIAVCNMCKDQLSNLEECRKNGWSVPTIKIFDPGRLLRDTSAQIQKHKIESTKRKVRLVVATVVIVMILVGIGAYSCTMKDITKLSYGTADLTGMPQSQVLASLHLDGFENVSAIEDESGWMQGGIVTSVSIGDDLDFRKGEYKNKKSKVVVRFSSIDRVEVSGIMSELENEKYDLIQKKLYDKGIKNVLLKESITSKPELDQMVECLKIGNTVYTQNAEKCWIPRSASIEITYYDLKYYIGKYNEEFIEEDVETVVGDLTAKGFTNIKTQESAEGWRSPNSVMQVKINNTTDYSFEDAFKPDVDITIDYSSQNRIDASDLFVNAKKTNYIELQKQLKLRGISNIQLESVTTENHDLMNLVSTLSVDSVEWDDDECYLDSNATVTISYYDFRPVIGTKASELIGRDYNAVVNELREKGFTKVKAQASDSGWMQDRLVMNVTVDGENAFKETDAYDRDVQVIVEYSSEGRVNATSCFNNWEDSNYSEVVDKLDLLGITSVVTERSKTTDASLNGMVEKIMIGDENFKSGNCYLPASAEVHIVYHCLNLAVGNTNDALQGEEYHDVVSELKRIGFTNIQLQRSDDLVTGIVHKEGSVKQVAVNGSSSFAQTDLFDFDVPIVVTVNTYKGKGCTDIP